MKFFTYQFHKNGQLLRIGKGHCYDKSNQSVARYLNSRYGKEAWDESAIQWHYSEAAALKHEVRLLDDYVDAHGFLPPLNSARGGGGRQIFVKCKSHKRDGRVCANDTLVGNYNYCGVHRRYL